MNDTLGHQAGDDLLVEIAFRLQGVLREEDTAARIHGDEFVVLLTEVEDQSALDLVAAKINGVFSQSFAIAGQSLNIKTSIGSALYPDDATDIEALMNISDQQMYKQKHQDNNQRLRPVVINADVSSEKITA
ncbi:MAG: GGDEF domain-containing protein [Motiliproteus sp.]